MTPQQIPDKATRLFEIVAPLGYKTDKVCSLGHTVSFKHVETGGEYTPFTVNNQIVCGVCLAPVIGLVCARTHLTFEVEDA
jgi:hypothetical protein